MLMNVASDTITALSLRGVEWLFDQLPRASFFVKDRSLKYVGCNEAMAQLCGVERRGALVGLTARDFFPEASWTRFEAMDRFVIRSGRPIKDQLQLITPLATNPIWVVLCRWPVVSDAGQVIGVASLGRWLDSSDRRHPTYQRLARAIEHIQANPHGAIDVNDLARRSGVSVSQFERDFSQLFGLSPRRYATRVRIEAALNLLRGDDPIAQIAHACGYADQSAFTRRFKHVVGMTPGEYRRTFSEAYAPPPARPDDDDAVGSI